MKVRFWWLCVALVWGVTASAQESIEGLQKLLRAYRTIERNYLDSVDMQSLTDGALRGLVEGLDPHSTYLSREEAEAQRPITEGEFGGIGVEYQLLRDSVTILAVVAGGPAEEVGLLPGDRIVRVEERSAVGMTQQEVVDCLRGEVGSRVEVGVSRRGVDQLLTFRITRGKIPLHTIDAAYMASERVGYIKVGRFGRTTIEEFKAAYERLNAPRRLILDLRGNGGGLLDQAVALAEFFLPKGALIFSTEGRTDNRKCYARRDGQMTTGRVVVLVDGNSASASELVSGALQDWDRATLVGQRTFGKGLVQRELPLGDGSKLRLTISQYLTPSGRAIQRPYRAGERQDYYRDHLVGYHDSITEQTPHFRTLNKGRKIYGGGGVRPDVEVQSDTTGYSDYYAQLVRHGLLAEVVVDWLDGARRQLEADYPTLDQFVAHYGVETPLFEALISLAEQRGVAYDEEQFVRSKPWIECLLKAQLAQRLYGAEGFYRVVNPTLNESYKIALQLIDK